MGLSAETQRVDFKQTYEKTRRSEVAKDACAFANAYGGLIVVGVRDPDKHRDEHGDLVFGVEPILATDVDALCNILVDAINPPIEFDVAYIVPNSGGSALAIIRIAPSITPPHEVLATHGFYIRRGRRIHNMSLAEIESAIARRNDGASVQSKWFGLSEPAHIHAGPHLLDAFGDHVGVSISPIQGHIASHEHSREDDARALRLVRLLRRDNKICHLPIENGLLLGESASRDLTDISGAGFALEILGNGNINLRQSLGWLTDFSHDVDDLINTIAVGYFLAAKSYHTRGFGPRVHFRVQLRNRTRCNRSVNVLPSQHDLGCEIDLSNAFEDEFTRMVERIWRSAGSSPSPYSISKRLIAVWENSFVHPQQRSPWA